MMTAPKFYALFTEDGLDQLVETKELANREAKDLRAMGCTVSIRYMTEDEADIQHWKINGGLR